MKGVRVAMSVMNRLRSVVALAILFVLPAISHAATSEGTAKSYFEEGIALNKQQRYDEALEKFTRAVTSSLDNHRYHQGLFMTYIAMRRGLQGIQFYQALLKDHPESAVVHYWLGRLYLESRSLENSLSEFREAARLAPQDALTAYLQANKLSPRVAVVHAGIGTIYYNRNDLSKARREYEDALKLDDSLTEARYNLGLIYEKKGEFSKAVKEWQALLDQDPNESRARERLARIYFRTERYEDAVQEYSTLSQVKQNSPEVFLALGESAIMLASTVSSPEERKQLKDLAVQAFQRTLDLDPANAQAREYLDRLQSKDLPVLKK
jgi:tetratricopeptide (TPR) repeat protein